VRGHPAAGGRYRRDVARPVRDAPQRGALDPRLDADAASRVLLAIGQGFAVQNASYEDLDVAAFREAAIGLLSQATQTPRLSG
jgi:hypothetical protein